jgi:hypothetical protein
MYVSPYRTSVTAAHQDFGKRVEPSLVNGRAKPGAPKVSNNADR